MAAPLIPIRKKSAPDQAVLVIDQQVALQFSAAASFITDISMSQHCCCSV
jgi:hypothetical protein